MDNPSPLQKRKEMEIKDNSIYLENKVTGQVIYIMWQDKNRPEYAKYMTMDGIKSVRYADMARDRKIKDQVHMELGTYMEKLSAVLNQHNA